MLISSMNISDNDMGLSDLVRTEKYLAAVYDDISSSEISISEGFISKILNFIKSAFKAALKLLVKIWNAIVSFCKSVISLIWKFINKLRGKKEIHVKRTISLITESFNIKSVTISTTDQLKSAVTKAMMSISKRIASLSKENIEYVKMMEKRTSTALAKTEAREIVNGLHGDDRIDITRYDSNMIYSTDDTTMAKVGDKYESDFVPDWRGVFPGDSFSYNMNKNDLEMFKNADMEKILQEDQANIVEVYNAYISGVIDNVARATKKFFDSDSNSGANRFKQLARNVEEQLMSDWITFKRDPYLRDHEDVCKRYLQNKYFPTFEIYPPDERPARIRQWLNLKIHFNSGIINTLNNMITINAAVFKLSNEEVEQLTSSIRNQNMSAAREFMKKHISDMTTHNGEVIDGRKFGLGVVCIAKSMVHDDMDNAKYKGIYSVETNPEYSDKIFVYLTRYDVTVLTHGGYEEVQASDKYSNKRYVHSMDVNAMSYNRGNIEETDTYMDWICDPIITPDGKGPYTSVFDMLRQLIKDGYKRINVLACNGGHLVLPDDIKKAKGVVIQMNADLGLV